MKSSVASSGTRPSSQTAALRSNSDGRGGSYQTTNGASTDRGRSARRSSRSAGPPISRKRSGSSLRTTPTDKYTAALKGDRSTESDGAREKREQTDANTLYNGRTQRHGTLTELEATYTELDPESLLCMSRERLNKSGLTDQTTKSLIESSNYLINKSTEATKNNGWDQATITDFEERLIDHNDVLSRYDPSNTDIKNAQSLTQLANGKFSRDKSLLSADRYGRMLESAYCAPGGIDMSKGTLDPQLGNTFRDFYWPSNQTSMTNQNTAPRSRLSDSPTVNGSGQPSCTQTGGRQGIHSHNAL